ncbi:MAG: 4Fe-4S dicluster domain-containing protein [Candidatus Aminicenantes bacterium]|nr:4Fe-4S dicluster domain-containing protein [Candidatus Aminicenantes bacterium]
MDETMKLKSFAGKLGVDLFGVADLKRLQGLPVGMGGDPAGLTSKFRYAIVLGAQLNKLGEKATGIDVDFFLEKAAMQISAYLEKKEDRALIIHPEDELDPVRRLGLLSLKVLAKAAGLGWQGRSLLIVSPEYGPVHRWIAVLTNLDLQPGKPLANRCGDCTLCIDQCPQGALTYVSFADHPDRREDVLDIQTCKGDDSCRVCLEVCPWQRSFGGGA